MISQPTRLNHILDLFFTNFPALIQDMQIIPGLTDHDIITIKSKIKPSFLKQTSRKIPLYDKADQSISNGLQLLVCCIQRKSNEHADAEHLVPIMPA